LRGTFRHISAQLFVLVQPEGDEGIEAVNVSESTEADGGDTQAEIAVRGASAAEDAEDNGEAAANTSTEAVATEAAAAREMWVLESRLVFEMGGFVKNKWCIKPT
jgi:hypothetical protein